MPLRVRSSFSRSSFASYLIASTALLLLATTSPYAIERHPAPSVSSERITSLPGNTTQLSNGGDETPLGVAVSGIVVNDSVVNLPAHNVQGVAIQSANPAINQDALHQILGKYLGQPLSFKLIGDIRKDIVSHMRANDRPLVAVVVPPQEITGGTLRIAVLPFKLGDKKVERIPSDHQRTGEEEILNEVRAQSGDEINSAELISDLNWLNRSPYRKVGVIFSEGGKPGSTDLTLTLRDDKPWQVFGGYTNSGTKSTGYHRLFGGFAAELPWDALISYQMVASPDTLFSDGSLFQLDGKKAYLSNAFAYTQHLEDRSKLTLTGNHIRTRAKLTHPFVQDSKITELGGEYAFPVERFSPIKEAFVGFDAKWQQVEREFNGTGLGPSNIDIYQLKAGLRGDWSKGRHSFDYELTGVISPGGISGDNTNAAYRAFTNNQSAKARYAYLRGWMDYSLSLPSDFSFDLSTRLQLASDALPGLEQFDLGGRSSVRGYQTGEVAGDHGISMQAELHAPIFKQGQFAADLFAFADYGITRDIAASKDHELASLGLGVNTAFADHVALRASWGHALLAGPTTKKNDNRFDVILTMQF